MVEVSKSKKHATDRRPASRRHVLLPGLVVFANGAFTCDCTFRNLSSTGARVIISRHVQFPDRFYLINVRDGLAYDAQLVWKKGIAAGVKFESVVLLSTNIDLALAYLKRLWLAKTPRGRGETF
jgi:hypothetical protein